MMQCIEDLKLLLRGIQDLQHMRNAVIRFGNRPNAVPYFVSYGNEVVIRIDHQKGSDLFFIRRFFHVLSSWDRTQVASYHSRYQGA